MTDDDESILPEWATSVYPLVRKTYLKVDPVVYSPFDYLRQPRTTEAEDIREWIKKISVICNTTPTEIANKAKLAPSTLNKFMVDAGNLRNLNANTLNKIQKVVGDLILTRDLSDRLYVEKVFGIDGSGDIPLVDSNPYQLRKITVIGNIFDNSAVYKKEVQLEEERMYDIVLPVSKECAYRGVFALQLTSSVNEEYYKYQDLFICLPIWRGERSINNDDRVIIIQQEKNPEFCRLSIRDCTVDPKGHSWLISPYSEHDEIAPIYLGKGGKSGLPPNVAILFLVVGSYHQRQP